ncbi:glutathione S-transferase N-terminal domain-containing protein [Siccirubricoccus deserti]
MKLAHSPASPYVRKAVACAIARGIDQQVELWTVGTTDPALLPLNPLSKVPSLLTDDGMALYDSPVICEYLDSIGDAPKLFPAPVRRAGRRCSCRRWAMASSTPPSRAGAKWRCRRMMAGASTSRCSRARWRGRWTCWRPRRISSER